jgi:hypothetical protein
MLGAVIVDMLAAGDETVHHIARAHHTRLPAWLPAWLPA